jgi:DNA-binding GntR family transcriptional regulator
VYNRHSRLVDDVVRSLSSAILSGDLRPGDHLTVIPIAQEYGISQSTTREALLMLEQRGLVSTNPRRGAFVTRLSAQAADDLCRMRALLEAYTITVAGPDVVQTTLEALRQQVAAMSRITLPRDLPQLIQCDLAFHQSIAELGRSETLLDMWSKLSGRIGALILRSMEEKQLRLEDVVALSRSGYRCAGGRDAEIGRRAIIQHYIRGQAGRSADQTDALNAAAQATAALGGIPAATAAANNTFFRSAPTLHQNGEIMQESKLRVAVLGAGAWANFAHIPGWQRDPRCEVVAICDPVGDRAQEFAAKFNIPVAASDWQEIVGDPVDRCDRRVHASATHFHTGVGGPGSEQARAVREAGGLRLPRDTPRGRAGAQPRA